MVFTRSVSQQTQAMAAPAQALDSSNGVLSKARSFSSRPLRQTQTPNPSTGHPASRRHANPFSSPSLLGQKRKSEALFEVSSHKESESLVFERRFFSTNKTKMRGTSDLSGLSPEINTLGLSDLKLSGSGTMTEPRMESLKKLAGDAHVIVVDLRQEPHCVANDYPVMWTKEYNWVNKNLPLTQVQPNEDQRIADMKAFVGSGSLTLTSYADIKQERSRPMRKVLVSPSIVSEQEIVERHGMQYERIGVPDHSAPKDEAVDRFLILLRNMPKNAWLHVHCKAGCGRTTTFMALYDMLRNASDVGLEDITSRQGKLGFEYDLMGLGQNPDPIRIECRRERRDFIRDFYEFAKTKPLETNQSWTEWKAARATQS